MAKPLTDDERARIVELLGEGKSRNEIAEIVGRSRDAVTLIAKSIGHRFGQTNNARAREARSAYCSEARAQTANDLQLRIQKITGTFEEAREQVVSTGAGVERLMVKPDARAIRDLASAIHTLQRTVLDIDRHDNRADEGAAQFDVWLRVQTGQEAAS